MKKKHTKNILNVFKIRVYRVVFSLLLLVALSLLTERLSNRWKRTKTRMHLGLEPEEKS